VVEAVVDQVGREGARRLFLRALRAPPKGKPVDSKEDALLLAAYDRVIARGVSAQEAALEAAEERWEERVIADEKGTADLDVQAIASQIRRLVRGRAAREAAWAKWREENPPTLLGELLARRRSETDI
jgi:hypothetical protein